MPCHGLGPRRRAMKWAVFVPLGRTVLPGWSGRAQRTRRRERDPDPTGPLLSNDVTRKGVVRGPRLPMWLGWSWPGHAAPLRRVRDRQWGSLGSSNQFIANFSIRASPTPIFASVDFSPPCSLICRITDSRTFAG